MDLTRNQWLTAILIVAASVAVFSSAFPLFVNNPFHLQGARELQLALWIVRQQVWVEYILGATALVALALLWQGAARRGALPALAIFAAIGLNHVDIYSLIFHRMDRPEFDDAARSGVARQARVLAVRVNGAARAYPVLPLAYHHVVNDRLGGVPLAATW